MCHRLNCFDNNSQVVANELMKEMHALYDMCKNDGGGHNVHKVFLNMLSYLFAERFESN